MAEIHLKSTIQFRRGTKEEWETINPILRAGEPGVAVDTQEYKIGDGVTRWNDLPAPEGGLEVLQGAGAPSDEIEATVGQTYYDTTDSSFYLRKEGVENVWEKMVNQQDLDNIDIPNVGIGEPPRFYKNETIVSQGQVDWSPPAIWNNYIFLYGIKTQGSSSSKMMFFSDDNGENFYNVSTYDANYKDFSDPIAVPVYSASNLTEAHGAAFVCLSKGTNVQKEASILSINKNQYGNYEGIVTKLSGSYDSLKKIIVAPSYEQATFYIICDTKDGENLTKIYFSNSVYFSGLQNTSGLISLNNLTWSSAEIDFPHAYRTYSYDNGNTYIFPEGAGDKYTSISYGMLQSTQTLPYVEKWNFPCIIDSSTFFNISGWNKEKNISDKIVIRGNAGLTEVNLPSAGTFGRIENIYFTSSSGSKHAVFIPPCYREKSNDTESVASSIFFSTTDYGLTFTTYNLPVEQKWLKPVMMSEYSYVTSTKNFKYILLPENGNIGVYFKNEGDIVSGPIKIELPISQKWNDVVQIGNTYFLTPWCDEIDDNLNVNNIDTYAQKSEYILYSNDCVIWNKLKLPENQYWNKIVKNTSGSIIGLAPVIGERIYFTEDKGASWFSSLELADGIIQKFNSSGKYSWSVFHKDEYGTKNIYCSSYIGATTAEIAGLLVEKHNMPKSGAHADKANLEEGVVAETNIPTYLRYLNGIKINGSELANPNNKDLKITAASIPMYNSSFINSSITTPSGYSFSEYRTISLGKNPFNFPKNAWSIPIMIGSSVIIYSDSGEYGVATKSKPYDFQFYSETEETTKELYKLLHTIIPLNVKSKVSSAKAYVDGKSYWIKDVLEYKNNFYFAWMDINEKKTKFVQLPRYNFKYQPRLDRCEVAGDVNGEHIGFFCLESTFHDNYYGDDKFDYSVICQRFNSSGPVGDPVEIMSGFYDKYRVNPDHMKVSYDESNGLIVVYKDIVSKYKAYPTPNNTYFVYSTDKGLTWNKYEYNFGYSSNTYENDIITFSTAYINDVRNFTNGIDVLLQRSYGYDGTKLTEKYIYFEDGAWIDSATFPKEEISGLVKTKDGSFCYLSNGSIYISSNGVDFQAVELPSGFSMNAELLSANSYDKVINYWILNDKENKKHIISSNKGTTWTEFIVTNATSRYISDIIDFYYLENSYNLFIRASGDNYYMTSHYSLGNWYKTTIEGGIGYGSIFYDKYDTIPVGGSTYVEYPNRLVDLDYPFSNYLIFMPDRVGNYDRKFVFGIYRDYQRKFEKVELKLYLEDKNLLTQNYGLNTYYDPILDMIMLSDSNTITTIIPLDFFAMEKNLVTKTVTINGKPIGDSVELTVSDIPGVAPILNTITLGSSLWSSDEPFTQSVSFDGILTDETKQVITVTASPEKSNIDSIIESGTYCTAQAENSLTFTAFNKKPETDQVFNISVQNV